MSILVLVNLCSLVTYSTSITFLSEYLKQINSTNVTLQHKPFSYRITIVAYNSEGMSSQPTSKHFGMNIHTCIATYVLYLVVPYVCIILIYHNLPVNSCILYSSHPRVIASGCTANTVIEATLG